MSTVTGWRCQIYPYSRNAYHSRQRCIILRVPLSITRFQSSLQLQMTYKDVDIMVNTRAVINIISGDVTFFRLRLGHTQHVVDGSGPGFVHEFGQSVSSDSGACRQQYGRHHLFPHIKMRMSLASKLMPSRYMSGFAPRRQPRFNDSSMCIH